MTYRDMQVISFIDKCQCYSDTIQKIFYPSITVANRRLRKLFEYGYLKRYREHTHECYFYFTKRKCNQMQHSDYIAKTYLWITMQGYKILDFDIQKKVDNIVPDMLCQIEKIGKGGSLPVEVELSNNNIDKKIKAYEKSGFKKLLLVSKKNYTSDLIEIININLEELS